MRQRNEARRVVGEGLHGLGDTGVRLPAQKVALRVLADEQRQLDLLHLREQPVVPELGALPARRQVAALAATRVAVAHRHDGHARGFVEHRAVDAEPAAKLVAAAVVPWHARLVHREAGRLPNDQQPGARAGLHHGARPQRQVRLAHAAGAHLGQQRFHGLSRRRA